MVWERAKYHYRHYPPSKKEEILEANFLKALDSDVSSIFYSYDFFRFCCRSYRFMDAYRKGLNGRHWQATYANKKYRGHHVISETIWKDLDDDNIH